MRGYPQFTIPLSRGNWLSYTTNKKRDCFRTDIQVTSLGHLVLASRLYPTSYTGWNWGGPGQEGPFLVHGLLGVKVMAWTIATLGIA